MRPLTLIPHCALPAARPYQRLIRYLCLQTLDQPVHLLFLLLLVKQYLDLGLLLVDSNQPLDSVIRVPV